MPPVLTPLAGDFSNAVKPREGQVVMCRRLNAMFLARFEGGHYRPHCNGKFQRCPWPADAWAPLAPGVL